MSRLIVARGQQMGRRLDTFIRLGDSNSSEYGIFGSTVQPFLNPLGSGSYNPNFSGLATNYSNLLDSWETYRAPNSAGKNSFSWIGQGASGGWGTINVLNGMSHDIAVANPGLAFIMIGTNEIYRFNDTEGYRQRLDQIVHTLVDQGILPVLSTIPPYTFADGAYQYRVREINRVIVAIADHYRVPLWNFWKSATQLPNQGIVQDADRIHFNMSGNGGGSFWSQDLLYAQNLRNLQALKILDWFQDTVLPGEPIYIAPRDGWQTMEASTAYYSVGRDRGISPTVDVYNAVTGKLVNRFLAFRTTFGGGVRVATGDVDGDGRPDIVVATGAGITATVKAVAGR